MSIFRNFSDYRRWIDVADFQATLERGQQMEQLWSPNFSVDQVLSIVDQGLWKSRLLPSFGGPALWLPPEVQLWDRTFASLPLYNLPGPSNLELEVPGTFTKFTLWITLPRRMCFTMLQTLLNGQEWTFDQGTFPLGNAYPLNFLFSPRSPLLWFTFLYSIGQAQGAHFDASLLHGPVTLGLRIPEHFFMECGHSWNRYYTDFFTYFLPQLKISVRLSPQLRGMVVLRHDFDLDILVRLLNRVRNGSFPGLFMLMHLPVTDHHFQMAQRATTSGEPPQQTLLRAPRSRL